MGTPLNDTMRLDKDIFTAFATTETLVAGAFHIGTAAQRQTATCL
jgi:hypothetical protein